MTTTTSPTLTSPTECVDCEILADDVAESGRCEACEARTSTLAEQLLDAYGLTCVPRWGTPRNFDRPTYGGKVAKIATKLGTPLMPWQRYVADTALEIYPETGLYVYRACGCTVPRQSGKTSLILPICCHRGMAWQRQIISYAAQSGTAAREKWEDDHVEALKDAGLIPTRARVRKANGREAIIWKATRSIHGLHANTERAGHGKTLHLGMLDEYFAQIDNRIYAAWEPAMITVDMAQFWWFSTAGTAKSIPMNEDRAAGRLLVQAGREACERAGTAYFEWSAPKGSDRRDPKVWVSCMPALCPHEPPCACGGKRWRHTVTINAMRAALAKANTPAKLANYDRAYLNITREDDEAEADPNVPTVEAWNLLADATAVGGDVLALAVDVTPLRDRAAIHAVGLGPDGKPLLKLLDYGEGIGWLLPRCLELNEALNPVAWALDEKSGAATLILPFDQAGIRRMGKEPHRGGLWIPTVQELGAACADMTDLVRNGGLVHLGQDETRMAIAAAKSRPLGDGSYAFGRKLAAGDISPLITGTLGLAAYKRFAHLATSAYDPLANIW